MPYEFKLPDLGEGIAEAELRKWLVREGERIAEHQAVAEVETDKAVVEVPSPRAGHILRLHQMEGAMVKVGEVLLSIAEEGETLPERPKSVGIVGELPEAEEMAEVKGAPPGPEVLATPMIRKLARERGIDLAKVKGSGPHDSVILEDLEKAPAALKRNAEAIGSIERIPLRGVRKGIARNVIASQRNTAFVTSMEEADITDLWELREREQQAAEAMGTHLTFLPFFIKATQHALREHPYLNASIEDATETILLKRYYNFGIAVETTDGLIVPVIREVDRKTILELAAEIHTLGEKARSRTIALAELKGSTFTITNYGHYGGAFATPIINWPDVAILGFGRITEKPWVHRGQIAIRRILPISLTFDHRVVDGAEAAQFVVKVIGYLEDPALLFIESI